MREKATNIYIAHAFIDAMNKTGNGFFNMSVWL